MNSAFKEPSSIEAAAQWLNQLLSGPLVLSLLTVAIAILGFRCLTGVMPIKSALRAVVGCAILGSAGFLANVFMATTSSDLRELRLIQSNPSQERPTASPAPVPLPQQQNPFDPYHR